MKNKYFTEAERYQFEILLKENYTPKEIAERLDKSLATIYNEKKRGMVTLRNSDYKLEYTERAEYCADVAQRKYDENKTNKGVDLKISNDYELLNYIEDKIKNENYSPYAVIGYIKSHKLEFKTSICFKTLYNYIDSGVFLNVTNKDLPMKCNQKQVHKHSRKSKVSLNNINARTIDSRAIEVLDRESYGHWEMDTVVGCRGGGKACLLVLSERMTRQERIIKIADKTQKSVVEALNEIENKIGYKEFLRTFKTITVDNGVEFLDCRGTEKSIDGKQERTVVYYCHPYSAWERGTNENINKMIRRFIPKGSDIEVFTEKAIQRIEDWINNYPRKIFNFFSSNEYLQAIQI